MVVKALLVRSGHGKSKGCSPYCKWYQSFLAAGFRHSGVVPLFFLDCHDHLNIGFFLSLRRASFPSMTPCSHTEAVIKSSIKFITNSLHGTIGAVVPKSYSRRLHSYRSRIVQALITQ